MSHLLLVTGSRALEGSAPAVAWAVGEIAARVERLPPSGVVLSGGASGPDTWAVRAAESSGLRWVVYRPDGQRLSSWQPERAWGPAGSPLARNRAMVAAASRARAEGWAVRVLGLVASQDLQLSVQGRVTHGTDHTLGLARRAGLEVERLIF